MPDRDTVRLAAVADIDCTRSCQDPLRALFGAAAGAADVLLLCGGLTAEGLPSQATLLARRLPGRVRVRVVPALRAGAVHRLRADGQGRPRPRVPPGRLHLRVPRGRKAGAEAHRAGEREDQDAGRLPRAVRPIPGRPAAARDARAVPVVRPLGRPRVRRPAAGPPTRWSRGRTSRRRSWRSPG
jgi:hypothetical protein